VVKISIKNRFIKAIKFCYNFLKWIKAIGITNKMQECFQCDKYNIIWYLSFLFFIFALIIWCFGFTFSKIGIESIFILYYFYALSYVCWALIILSAISLLIAIITINWLYRRSLSIQNKNSEFDGQGVHHGIVFTRYSKKTKDISVLDCVALLYHGFSEKVPFRVYECRTKEKFEELYYNPSIKWLWILGHGDKGGLCYEVCDDDHYLKYSELRPEPSKLFIAQLHCNSGEGKSLVELNNLFYDYDINHYRLSLQNRCYIIKKIPEFITSFEIQKAISEGKEWI
jgi:hypothetical protein